MKRVIKMNASAHKAKALRESQAKAAATIKSVYHEQFCKDVDREITPKALSRGMM